MGIGSLRRYHTEAEAAANREAEVESATVEEQADQVDEESKPKRSKKSGKSDTGE